jgi:broad specificity phosphatase PhoE
LQAPRLATHFISELWAPSLVWSLVHGCCWVLGIGQCPEWPRAAWTRVAQATRKILAHLEAGENIILVSHGWFITLLALHLRWRGLIERGPLIPKTGYGAMTAYHLRVKDKQTRAAALLL